MQAKRAISHLGAVVLAIASQMFGAEPPQKKADYSVKLQETAKRMLSAIQNNRPEELGAFLSAKGVTLGVDTPPTPKRFLLKMLRERYGFFCGVFDSRCLAKEDAAWRKRAGAKPLSEPILSYRERLSTAKSKALEGGISTDFGGKTANLEVVLDKGTSAEVSLSFEFVLEQGEWRLSGIPTW